MEPRINYTIVGAFVIVLGVVLVGIVLWLGKGYDRQVYDRYYAFMGESVSGLNVNAPVKYRGVEVGRVAEIVLDPDNPERVRLTLDIVRGTPIKEDTVAVLNVQVLTGLAIVDLTGGSRDAKPLTARPGEPYPVIKTKPSLLVRFNESATLLLNNLNRVTEALAMVLDDETRKTIDRLLTDVAQVTHQLAAHDHEVGKSVTYAVRTLKNLERVTQHLTAQLPALMSRVQTSAAALENMSRRVAQTSTRLDAAVERTAPDLQRFAAQTLPEASTLIAELRDLTATLQRVAQQLEREPQSLLFGRSAEPRGPGE
ncbi:MAG: MCE family protein [Nitrospirae bacterium]|nr:MAG: MCE family protein [Nitrospirota bacterium]